MTYLKTERLQTNQLNLPVFVQDDSNRGFGELKSHPFCSKHKMPWSGFCHHLERQRH